MINDLKMINNTESLISYFVTKLDWDMDLDDFDDIEDVTYDFDARDLGLKDEAFAKITSLKQLRPLVDNQKWGVFFVDFESEKFEVTALRKILSGLIPTRRNAANHAVWDKNDLLFICTWGGKGRMTIGAAHFEDEGKGLPQIKMISCEPAAEDFTQLSTFESRLEKLRWPKDPSDVDAWCEQWSSAFTTRYRQVIQDSHTLTVRLAEEARGIRDLILKTLEVETERGYVHQLMGKFRDTLVHDMSERDFADMYAQTIVYGLFSARCMDDTQEDFSAKEAIDCIPSTNPFLKSLMKECFEPRKVKGTLSFDELEIGNIVELLLHAQTDAIIADFNRQTGGGREDPVIHFYEEFLTEYDKSQKVQRGVYYTPQPVVNFIVRAVDDILKRDFGYEDGLATTSTIKRTYERQSKKKIDGKYVRVKDSIDAPAVQILDPSTGTGTFIRQVILQIYENFCAARKGMDRQQIRDEWNRYVYGSLLPRLNAFELMMAPYAVAHMKLAMVLKDTGYKFENDSRLQVFLTNSLEEAGNSDAQMSLFDDPLALESIQANAVKSNDGINVIIGNPPYAGSSSNNGDWIMSLIESYKKEPETGEKLREQNGKWINDDAYKFIRLAQDMVLRSGCGVVAFINPHGYLDSTTLRGMRWSLLTSFDEIYVLDLHGNSKKKEYADDGSKDENVFDIQQGVCINIFVKKPGSASKGLARVFRADIKGLREHKYKMLNEHSIDTIGFERIVPMAPYYSFVQMNTSLYSEYLEGASFAELFPVSVMGFQTHRDSFAVAFEKSQLEERIADLRNHQLATEEVRSKYQLKDNRDWKLEEARRRISSQEPASHISRCLYRPFDWRWCYLDKAVMDYPRTELISHVLHRENYVIGMGRQGNAVGNIDWCLSLTTPLPVDANVFRRGGVALAPLFLYSDSLDGEKRRPNLNNDVVKKFESVTDLHFSVEDSGSDLNPISIMDYCFAFVHANPYIDRYKDYLAEDYPRIPMPTDASFFVSLSKLGEKLRTAQNYAGNAHSASVSLSSDSCEIEIKPKYQAGRIYVSKSNYIEGVVSEVWEYCVGGFRPAEKWLADRKGMLITEQLFDEYSNVLGSIEESIQIEEAISAMVTQAYRWNTLP